METSTIAAFPWGKQRSTLCKWLSHAHAVISYLNLNHYPSPSGKREGLHRSAQSHVCTICPAHRVSVKSFKRPLLDQIKDPSNLPFCFPQKKIKWHCGVHKLGRIKLCNAGNNFPEAQPLPISEPILRFKFTEYFQTTESVNEILSSIIQLKLPMFCVLVPQSWNVHKNILFIFFNENKNLKILLRLPDTIFRYFMSFVEWYTSHYRISKERPFYPTLRKSPQKLLAHNLLLWSSCPCFAVLAIYCIKIAYK